MERRRQPARTRSPRRPDTTLHQASFVAQHQVSTTVAPMPPGAGSVTRQSGAESGTATTRCAPPIEVIGVAGTGQSSPVSATGRSQTDFWWSSILESPAREIARQPPRARWSPKGWPTRAHLRRKSPISPNRVERRPRTSRGDGVENVLATRSAAYPCWRSGSRERRRWTANTDPSRTRGARTGTGSGSWSDGGDISSTP